jgi:broad specificity phosphatase PhoE
MDSPVQGNVDESMYTRIPDSKISLTERGKRQAEDAGRRIREIIEAGQEAGDDNWMVYFYVSPYLRTLQTLRGIGAAFERRRIAGVREEPRLREQDFGEAIKRKKENFLTSKRSIRWPERGFVEADFEWIVASNT